MASSAAHSKADNVVLPTPVSVPVMKKCRLKRASQKPLKFAWNARQPAIAPTAKVLPVRCVWSAKAADATRLPEPWGAGCHEPQSLRAANARRRRASPHFRRESREQSGWPSLQYRNLRLVAHLASRPRVAVTLRDRFPSLRRDAEQPGSARRNMAV